MSRKREVDYSNVARFVLIFVIVAVVFILLLSKTSKNSDKNGDEEISRDTTAPVIALNDEKAVVAVDGQYRIKATATDDVDGDISDKIKASEIDTSKEGEQEITLSVQDSSGNSTEVKQTVIVRAELTGGLPVTMYHFFYDGDTYKKKDNNWLKIEDFESQIKYLSENDYYFPTWDEVNDYIDGNYKLPSKSVVLTVDDGDPSFFDLAVPVLQKYNIPATSFVITDWYGDRYDANLKCVVWESHSAAMHESGANGKGRMVNWTYDQITADLKQSSEALGGAKVFCYPFGHYNDTAIKALQDTSYIMAFTVESGKVKVGANKYKLPRVRVSDGNSLNYFIKSIS